jgi:serine/threonine-protein kinase RsbW
MFSHDQERKGERDLAGALQDPAHHHDGKRRAETTVIDDVRPKYVRNRRLGDVSLPADTGTPTCVTIDTDPRPLDSLSIEVVAAADRLREIRHQMLTWLGPIGLSDTNAADIVLVVNEACTNCIEHAYRDGDPGLIRVRADVEGRQIVVGIADFGVWQTPSRRLSTRGRGLPIMQAVSDRIELNRTAAGTIVRITFDTGPGC